MHRQVTKGSTNVSINVRIVDSTDGTPETGVVFNTAGIDMWYRREGAASVDITEVTLAALTTAHTDGGFLHINDGWYRLDVPDAAFATGVDGVQIGGTVTGMVVIAPYVELTDIDLYDGVRGGMTALPNAAADAAGGLIISDAGGLDADAQATSVAAIEVDTSTTLQAELDGIQADTEDIQSRIGTPSNFGSGTSTLAANLEDLADNGTAAFDRSTDSLQAIRDRGDAAWTTGGGGSSPTTLQNTTIATLASQTSFTLTAGSADDDAYNGMLAIVTDQSTSTQKAVGVISDYTGSTRTITLREDPGIFTMAVGDTVDVVAVSPDVLDILADTGDMQPKLGTPAADLSADVAAVKTETASILVDTGTTLDGKIDTIDTVVDGIQTDLSNGTDGLGAIKADTAATLVDTGTTLPATLGTLATAADLATVDTVVDGIQTDLDNGTDGLGALKALIDAVKVDTAAILIDTGTDGVIVASINTDALDAAATAADYLAEINAEVVDVFSTDTVALPGQTAPPATPTRDQMLTWLYKVLRNRKTQTATQWSLLADNESTVDAKATISDDGTTATKQEIVSGP